MRLSQLLHRREEVRYLNKVEAARERGTGDDDGQSTLPPPPSSLVCPLLFPSKSRAKGPSAVPRCLDSLSRSQRRLSPTVLKKKLKQAPASVVISTPKDALNDIAGLGPCAAAAAASKQQRRSSASFGGLVRALSRSPIGGSAGGAGALADSCEMSPKSAQTDEERGERRRMDREKTD